MPQNDLRSRSEPDTDPRHQGVVDHFVSTSGFADPKCNARTTGAGRAIALFCDVHPHVLTGRDRS
jgi:hypothetical protein